MKSMCPPKNEQERDKVMTPPSLATAIVNHFPIRGSVIEPCAGDNAFVDALFSLPYVRALVGGRTTRRDAATFNPTVIFCKTSFWLVLVGL